MKKQYYILFVFIMYFSLSLRGSDRVIVGARAKGMGDVAVGIPCFWSVRNNQAAMPFYGKMSAGLYYDNRYLLKETSTVLLGCMFPLKDKSNVFGGNISHYGGKNFGEMEVGIAYAKSFAGVFSFGLQFDYLLTSFGDSFYGKRSGFTFEAGIYGQVTKNVSLGFHAYNPARLKMITYNDVSEYIPTILRLAIACKFGKKCLAGFDVEKNLDTKMQCHAGVEYAFFEYFVLRGGLRFPDFSGSIGVGVQVKGLSIDVASSYHFHLGYSPQLSLAYAIK